MKKLFTLALVLLIAVGGYSQVKKVSKNDAKQQVAKMQKSTGMEALSFTGEINMMRTDGELDATTYDWQSNDGARTWTHVWDDGKVNFAFTVASDVNFSDRGTAIGTYDAVNDEWIQSGGRVENEKTGFGSIAQYGDNGLVVAAHTASDLGIYIIEDKDNIVPNSAAKVLGIGTDQNTHPAVMTSGENRDIIHVLCAYMQGSAGNVSEPIYYYRSSNGGQSWDKEAETIPFLTEEYGLSWGTNSYYWMETTDDNCLAFVVNNAWSDGMVIYSYDNGETWERKVFYAHPNITGDFTDTWFFYPRWTSCQWDSQMNLHVLYEFNGSTETAGSGSYYPALGGVAYWNENLLYNEAGNTQSAIIGNLEPGKPFVMDSAYMYSDIYASWWLWSDATHEMWPEYIGYLAALDENGQPEDPEEVTEFNIEDRSLHGSYNCGCCAMPVLCKVGDSDYDFVAVWSAMDENNKDGNDNFFFKLFCSYTADGGLTWAPQIQLTTDFMYQWSECVYTQAAVVGHTLVVASQMDGTTGTYVQSDDDDASDCYYQGLTFDLDELFPEVGVGVNEVNNNTHMNIYPNPAVDQLNVILSQNAEIVVYNLMGQAVKTVEGHVGANTIDLSSINSGVYFISAGSDTQKFIVK